MRSAALAFKAPYDEVSVSSTEVLEANVVAIRDALIEFKNEVRGAFASMHHEIRSLRERGDKNFERLSTKIDATNARIDETNKEVTELGRAIVRAETTVDSLKWLWGGVGGFGGLFLVLEILNKLFHWY